MASEATVSAELLGDEVDFDSGIVPEATAWVSQQLCTFKNMIIPN